VLSGKPRERIKKISRIKSISDPDFLVALKLKKSRIASSDLDQLQGIKTKGIKRVNRRTQKLESAEEILTCKLALFGKQQQPTQLNKILN